MIFLLLWDKSRIYDFYTRNENSYFFRIPTNKQVTPMPIHTNLLQDNLSAMPISPMVVVAISTSGPTSANIELTTSAFAGSFNRSIIIAARSSRLPDKNRSPAILITNLSHCIALAPFIIKHVSMLPVRSYSLYAALLQNHADLC